MKRKILFSFLGMTVVSSLASFGQAYISLDNYDSLGAVGGPLVTYGHGVPANGFGGAPGTFGAGLNSAWTVGIYYATGTLAITDPAGIGIPSLQLSLGTGPGSTVQFETSTFGVAGEFVSPVRLNVGGVAGEMITAEIVAYAGSSYATSLFRAHSAVFTMPTVAVTSPLPPLVGNYMSGFAITTVPEPSTFVLAGLGILSLLPLRQRATWQRGNVAT